MKKYLFIFLVLIGLYFLLFKIRMISDVRGFVVDSVTKNPIAGIRVERYLLSYKGRGLLFPKKDRAYFAYTDEKGEFIFHSEFFNGIRFLGKDNLKLPQYEIFYINRSEPLPLDEVPFIGLRFDSNSIAEMKKVKNFNDFDSRYYQQTMSQKPGYKKFYEISLTPQYN